MVLGWAAQEKYAKKLGRFNLQLEVDGVKEKDGKKLSRKMRLVEEVAGHLKDFINALQALDRMYQCIAQPNFAVSSLREIPLVGWQMSVAAYLATHHIELLLDAPVDFTGHSFHSCAHAAVEGGEALGGGGGCQCQDAVIAACHDWARGQHGDLLEIAPRSSAMSSHRPFSGVGEGGVGLGGGRGVGVKAFYASLPQFRSVSQMCIIEVRVAAAGVDVQVAFFRTEASTREHVLHGLSACLNADRMRTMCRPVCVSLRDRALLLQLGICLDTMPGGRWGAAAGAGVGGGGEDAGEIELTEGWGKGSKGNLSGGGGGVRDPPVLTFAGSPSWVLTMQSPATALAVFRSLVRTRHAQGFVLGSLAPAAGTGEDKSCGGVSSSSSQTNVGSAYLLGTLPFIPDAGQQPPEDVLGGEAMLGGGQDQDEIVLIQYRLSVCGPQIRAQVLVEPRNGSVMLQTKRGSRSAAGAGGDRVGGGMGGGWILELRELLKELGTTMFAEDERIASWVASIHGIRAACPSSEVPPDQERARDNMHDAGEGGGGGGGDGGPESGGAWAGAGAPSAGPGGGGDKLAHSLFLSSKPGSGVELADTSQDYIASIAGLTPSAVASRDAKADDVKGPLTSLSGETSGKPPRAETGGAGAEGGKIVSSAHMSGVSVDVFEKDDVRHLQKSLHMATILRCVRER